jgi:glucose/mannose-6-phosphate isomerase
MLTYLILMNILSPEEIKSFDQSDLFGIYEKWPALCEKAMSLKTNLPKDFGKQIENVLYVGMGSSGLCGEIFSDWVKPIWKIPLNVVKDFNLPAFASTKTFVLIGSPTGETAETISSLKEAIQKKCKIAVSAGGGTVEEICRTSKVPFTKIELQIVSRATFPYVFYPSANYLVKSGLLTNVETEISRSIEMIEKLQPQLAVSTDLDDNPAKQLAVWLKDGFPMIYSWGQNRSIAMRFRQDINENAKTHALSDDLPELGHNTMTSWEKSPNFKAKPVFIRSPNEPESIIHRFNKLRELIESTGTEIFEVKPIDSNPLPNAVGTLYKLDLASMYLAVLNKVDPTPMRSQEKLRQDLLKRENSKAMVK